MSSLIVPGVYTENRFRHDIQALMKKGTCGHSDAQLEKAKFELDKIFTKLVNDATGNVMPAAQTASRIVFSSINGEIPPPDSLKVHFSALAVHACGRVAAQDTNLSQHRGNDCLTSALNNFELLRRADMTVLRDDDVSALLLPLCGAWTHVIQSTKNEEYRQCSWYNLESIVFITAASRLPNAHAARVLGYGVASMAELARRSHYEDRAVAVYNRLIEGVKEKKLLLPAWLCAQLQGHPKEIFGRSRHIFMRSDCCHPGFL